MKIAIAADHGGFELKDSMVEYIKVWEMKLWIWEQIQQIQ